MNQPLVPLNDPRIPGGKYRRDYQRSKDNGNRSQAAEGTRPSYTSTPRSSLTNLDDLALFGGTGRRRDFIPVYSPFDRSQVTRAPRSELAARPTDLDHRPLNAHPVLGRATTLGLVHDSLHSGSPGTVCRQNAIPIPSIQLDHSTGCNYKILYLENVPR